MSSVQHVQVDLTEVPMNKIKLGDNSRLNIANDSLVDLMTSIKEHGMLQAPVVMKNPKGSYDLIAGRRRFLAAGKLGWSKIKVAIHTIDKETDVVLKNLTENIQRSNISLVEVGRYIEKLRKDMSPAEIAVRLGVSKNFVETASKAFNEVPKEFQKYLVLSKGNERPKPGQVPITTAKSILNARRAHNLTTGEVKRLFKAARTDENFQAQQIPKYAQAMKTGKKNFTKVVKPMRTMSLQYYVTEEHWADLHRKYVENGPFRGMNEFIQAVLQGKKAVKIEAQLKR